MPIDAERLAHGRAVISRSLGGARLAHSVDSLVAALAEAFALERAKPAETWPDYVALALAEVDSDLERGAMWQRARDAAQARANNAETELRRVRLAMADQTARFNALYARHEELTAALATVARIIGKDSGNG